MMISKIDIPTAIIMTPSEELINEEEEARHRQKAFEESERSKQKAILFQKARQRLLRGSSHLRIKPLVYFIQQALADWSYHRKVG